MKDIGIEFFDSNFRGQKITEGFWVSYFYIGILYVVKLMLLYMKNVNRLKVFLNIVRF